MLKISQIGGTDVGGREQARIEQGGPAHTCQQGLRGCEVAVAVEQRHIAVRSIGEQAVFHHEDVVCGAALLPQLVDRSAVGVFEGVVNVVAGHELQAADVAGRVVFPFDATIDGAVGQAALDLALPEIRRNEEQIL